MIKSNTTLSTKDIMTYGQFHIPSSWSSLSWQQLCMCWQAKIRFGGNPDAARAAAMLGFFGCTVRRRGNGKQYDEKTGELQFSLRDAENRRYFITPGELACIARHELKWFDFPYGDHGEKPVKDEKGKVVKEGRNPVVGYVGPMRDTMELPMEQCAIRNGRFVLEEGKMNLFSKKFSLPHVACVNITWQQYRSLQVIAPQLFQDGIAEEQVLDLQAQFLAHILVQRSYALFDTNGGTIRFRPHCEYVYNELQAEALVPYFLDGLTREKKKASELTGKFLAFSILFHICFQCYQTALSYYSVVFPDLFGGGGKSDPLNDAIKGEVGTLNGIMKYAGYSEQQQVYDSNLPFILDILNTMTKEAKEIEKMNSKIKRK